MNKDGRAEQTTRNPCKNDPESFSMLLLPLPRMYTCKLTLMIGGSQRRKKNRLDINISDNVIAEIFTDGEFFDVAKFNKFVKDLRWRFQKSSEREKIDYIFGKVIKLFLIESRLSSSIRWWQLPHMWQQNCATKEWHDVLTTTVIAMTLIRKNIMQVLKTTQENTHAGTDFDVKLENIKSQHMNTLT